MYKLIQGFESKSEPETKNITIQQLLTMSQAELFAYLLRKLPQDHTRRVGKSIVVEAPMPKDMDYRPLLCAHLDTVAKNPPKSWEIETNAGVIRLQPWSKAKCLGGDDRAGVYILLQIINSPHYNRYSFVFFKDEEIGCAGSRAFTNTEEFDDIENRTSCFIGVDRKCVPGVPQIAQYGCDNDDLTEELQQQLPKFKLEHGSFTDCSTLSENSAGDIACFNITAGYLHEHTKNEIIHIDSMNHTVKALKKLCLSDKQFVFEPTYGRYGRFGWNYSDDFDYTRRSYSPASSGMVEHKTVNTEMEEIVCDMCGVHEPLYLYAYSDEMMCRSCFKIYFGNN